MKPGILLVAFLLGVASSGAQTVQDEVAIREKKRAVEVARVTSTINQTYLREYETLLQRANITGDAQGANLVRAMIRRLNPEPSPSASPASPDKKSSVDPETVLTSNHWFDHQQLVSENKRRSNFPMEFLPGGIVTCKRAFGTGTWKIVGNELAVEFTGGFEKFPLPVRLENWAGRANDGTPRYLDGFKSDGDAPAPTASPAGKPDYFGKPAP